MAGKFEVFKDKKGEYRFHLKATNGQIIAVGESYPEKKLALKGIASIVKNAPDAKIVDITGEEDAAKAAPKAPKAPAKPKGK